MKPCTKILQQIDGEHGNDSNLVKSQWSIKDVTLMNDLKCMNSIISSDNGDLFLRFIHCPILHSRRNEILIINNHCEYIEFLLDELMKIKQGLWTRWMLGSRSIKGKIGPLMDNLEANKIKTSWQHQFKHNLLVGYVLKFVFCILHSSEKV